MPDDASLPDPATAEEVPQVLIGISFDDVFRAQEFMTALSRLVSKDSLALHDAVLVVKDAKGDTKVVETIDPQPGRSALSGGMWAGLFGLLLGGPVGWIAGAALGAGAGAVTAKVIDLGISDAWVAWFKDTVQPDTATVAMLATDIDEDVLVAEVSRFAGGRLVYGNLESDMLDRVATALGQPGFRNP
ncbi:MAG TPA: DUF1269 domain-containing protein [Acidimicrobiales bacterium]|nr:DUF1269 domain-containing protein [Acidimicrobiales bacterium]